jgi:hypothetical protein
MITYKIVRIFKGNHPKQILKTGLTLRQAQTHCEDPQTCSDTCTTTEGKALTNEKGEWMDSYYPET